MVQKQIHGSKPYLWFKTIFMVQNHIYGSKPYSWSITIFMVQNHIYKVNIRSWTVLSDSFRINVEADCTIIMRHRVERHGTEIFFSFLSPPLFR